MIALPVSCTNLDRILPPTIVVILVGVINNLASSPRSRSPAIDSPIPNIHENKTTIAKTPGTRKSM